MRGVYRGLSARIHSGYGGNAAITYNVGHGPEDEIWISISSSRAHSRHAVARDGGHFRGGHGGGIHMTCGMTRGQGDRRLFPFSIRDFESFLLISSRPRPARRRDLAMCGSSPQGHAPCNLTFGLEIEPHTSTPLDAPHSTHRRQSSPNILDPFIRTARNGLRSTVRRPDRIRDCSSIFNGQR